VERKDGVAGLDRLYRYLVSVGTQFLGTKLSDAHTGALITATSPAFTFLFARMLLKESINRRKLFSLILSCAGMVTVIGLAESSGSLAGSVFLVMAAITWALCRSM
jgi:drug/metabolite transporter (DMT)-like permease